MGGGMGVGCHGSHRIVGESSQIAMPECGIGLVPDVGGSMILAQAPGGIWALIWAPPAPAWDLPTRFWVGFADLYIPQDKWPGLIAALETTGDPPPWIAESETAPPGRLGALRLEVDRHIRGLYPARRYCLENCRQTARDFAADALKALMRETLPLSCRLHELKSMQGLRTAPIREALKLEYRFTFRAMEHGDFLEGIRAAIIDKDRNPKWRYDANNLPSDAVETMLAPLGGFELTF